MVSSSGCLGSLVFLSATITPSCTNRLTFYTENIYIFFKQIRPQLTNLEEVFIDGYPVGFWHQHCQAGLVLLKRKGCHQVQSI